MSEGAQNMEYLFCCGQRPLNEGCGCSLKTATQIISFVGIIFALPMILGALTMDWKEYNEIPIIFAVYKGAGCIAPILMFVGSSKMDFGISYIGYFLHTIYVYGLIIFMIFIGIFWGLLVLPAIIVAPPFLIFFLTYYVFCIGYLGILLYFNDIYFSFTKYLGLGEVRYCVHKPGENIIYPQIVIQPQPITQHLIVGP
jgi:hypothetical protein